MELKAKVLHWLNKEQAVFAPMAKHFVLLLPGFLVCEAIVLWKSNEQKATNAETPTRLPEEKPVIEPNIIEISAAFVETDERPMITIRFGDDSAIVFDKKLGIGLALVLGFQAVAFNEPYSDVSGYSN